MACVRRARPARQRIPPRRQTLLSERGAPRRRRATLPRHDRTRLASTIVARHPRSAGTAAGACPRPGVDADCGRSHGPHGLPARYQPSRLPGALARRRRGPLVVEGVGRLSPRRERAGLSRGKAVSRRSSSPPIRKTWYGAQTGRTRGRRVRCRMRSICWGCSWIGRRAKPIAWRSSAPTLQGSTISVEVSRRRSPPWRRRRLRPDQPAARAGAAAGRKTRPSSSSAAA